MSALRSPPGAPRPGRQGTFSLPLLPSPPFSSSCCCCCGFAAAAASFPPPSSPVAVAVAVAVLVVAVVAVVGGWSFAFPWVCGAPAGGAPEAGASVHTRGSLIGGAIEAVKAQGARQERTISLFPASSAALVVSSFLCLLLWGLAVSSSPGYGRAARRAANGVLSDLCFDCASVPGRRL